MNDEEIIHKEEFGFSTRINVRSTINEYLLNRYRYKHAIDFVRDGDKIEEKLRYKVLMEGYRYDQIYQVLERRLDSKYINLMINKEEIDNV